MDENKDIRVSVIVPFYNAGKHIERCAESLMRQTLKDGIEFVFVNDGSTDDSLDKLVSVVSKYPYRSTQVKIESQPNQGSAAARQKGHDCAVGDYLIHCDADDWVEADMYESLLAVADREDADVVCSSFFMEIVSWIL